MMPDQLSLFDQKVSAVFVAPESAPMLEWYAVEKECTDHSADRFCWRCFGGQAPGQYRVVRLREARGNDEKIAKRVA